MVFIYTPIFFSTWITYIFNFIIHKAIIIVKSMIEQSLWNEQSDNMLKYLHEDLKIFNWNLISKELSQRMGLHTDPAACRIRYIKY